MRHLPACPPWRASHSRAAGRFLRASRPDAGRPLAPWRMTFYSTMKISRNRYISMKTNAGCHFYSTIIWRGGETLPKHASVRRSRRICFAKADASRRSCLANADLSRRRYYAKVGPALDFAQNKWDSVPPFSSRKQLKTNQPHTEEVGHFSRARAHANGFTNSPKTRIIGRSQIVFATYFNRHRGN